MALNQAQWLGKGKPAERSPWKRSAAGRTEYQRLKKKPTLFLL